MLNVNFDAERFLLRGQRMGDWTAPTPIELLPLLRRCYPRCIRDDFVSIQLVNAKWPEKVAWRLRVHTADFEAAVPINTLSQDRNDGYDYGDMPPADYPFELIARIIRTDRLTAWQDLIQLFEPDSLEMIERVAKDASSDELADLQDRLESAEQHANSAADDGVDRVDFLLRLAYVMSKHLDDRETVIDGVIADLKAEAPWQLNGDEAKSKWQELAREAHRPSLLFDHWKADLSERIVDHFGRLPRAVQLAMAFRTDHDEHFPGGSNSVDWFSPGPKVEANGLPGFRALVMELVDVVIQRADDDDEARAGSD